MDTTDTIAVIFLITFAFGIGWLVSQKSETEQPLHGGLLARLFNYLSASCFVVIFPTVLVFAFVIHPSLVQIAGIWFSPIILALIILAGLSYLFSFLHAIVEIRALMQVQSGDDYGWTEADARSSGL